MKPVHPTGLSHAESSETRAVLHSVANVIGPAVFPHGFILVTFSPPTKTSPTGARANYVGNIDRHDAIAAMKELIARWEGQSLKGGNA